MNSSLKVERQTVHVSDDSGRIAMYEKRTYGSSGDDNGTDAELTRYIYSNHLQSASLELDESGDIISYEEYHPYGTTSYQATNASIKAVAKRYRYCSAERDEESGLYMMGARYYASWLCRWLSPDPINNENYNLQKGYGLEKNKKRNYTELTLSSYCYCANNSIKLIDPNGEEPTRAQAGTIKGFVTTINTTGTQLGLKKGQDAHNAMLDLGKVGEFLTHGRPMPINTQRINTFNDKYIYTEKGGWIDMAHFMFYAGKAYGYKMQKEQAQEVMNSKYFPFMRNGQTTIIKHATMSPVGEAVQDGYLQEMSDRVFAKHSAYSYEDLPSDYFGADFGANYFDPDSKLSFGEQLTNYFNNVLGATEPENAPNYENIPATAADIGEEPSQTNHTTKPMYQKIMGEKGTMKHKTEKDPMR